MALSLKSARGGKSRKTLFLPRLATLKSVEMARAGASRPGAKAPAKTKDKAQAKPKLKPRAAPTAKAKATLKPRRGTLPSLDKNKESGGSASNSSDATPGLGGRQRVMPSRTKMKIRRGVAKSYQQRRRFRPKKHPVA